MIRPARLEDSAGLAAVVKDFGYQVDPSEVETVLQKHLDGPERYAFVAEVDGQIVGAIGLHVIEYFHRDASMLRVTYISVLRQHRRQGLARQLMDAANRFAVERGCDKLELTTGSHRSGEAHRFYESCGFTKYDGVRYVMRAACQQDDPADGLTAATDL